MTQFIKTAGYHVPLHSEPRTRARRIDGPWLAVALMAGVALGLMTARASYQRTERALIIAVDSAARSDYADLVNACYDRTRTQDADALYSCIATGND